MAFMSMGVDKFYKIEGNPINHKVRMLRNSAGPQALILIPTKNYTDTDSNTIYFNTSTGSDGNPGTKSSPKATHLASANACTATKKSVIILNSTTVAEILAGLNNPYYEGTYADTAITAFYTVRVLDFTPSDSNARFVKKTGNDTTGSGTQANPYLTITKAITALDGSHQAIVLMDSGVYIEQPFEMTGNFLKLIAAIGMTPTIQFIPAANYTIGGYVGSEIQINMVQGYNTQGPPLIMPSGNTILVRNSYGTNPYNLNVYVLDENNVLIRSFVAMTAYEISSMCLCKINDSEFIIVAGSPYTGSWYFCICDENMVTRQAAFLCAMSSTYDYEGRVKIQSNGNIVILLPFSTYHYFFILNNDGNYITSFQAAATNLGNSYSFDVNSADEILYSYSDSTDSSKWKYKIFNADYSLKSGPVTVSAYTTGQYRSLCRWFSDKSFVYIYSGNFCIYDSGGTLIKSSTVIDSHFQDLMYGGFVMLPNDLWCVHYRAWYSPDELGKVRTYDKLGNAITDALTFKTGDYYPTAVLCPSGIIKVSRWSLIDYSVITDTTPFCFSAVKISAAAIIHGITFDGSYYKYLYRMFTGTAKLTRRWCEVKNVSSDKFSGVGNEAYITSDIDTKECLIHDCDGGTHGESNSIVHENNAEFRITGNQAIYAKGAGSGVIIRHNTFFNNDSDIRLVGNNGSEIVKNNIHRKTGVWQFYADTAVTIINSIIDGSVCMNAVIGNYCMAVNPLFENEGLYDETQTNLLLKLSIFGNFADSPAYLLADDTSPQRDAGCYDTMIIGPATTWSAATLEKPAKGISRGLKFVNPRLTPKVSGDISSGIDAVRLVYNIKHAGLVKSQFMTLVDILKCKNNLIRYYGNPTTSPNDYETCKLEYIDTDASAVSWLNDDDFVENIIIQFSRAYE